MTRGRREFDESEVAYVRRCRGELTPRQLADALNRKLNSIYSLLRRLSEEDKAASQATASRPSVTFVPTKPPEPDYVFHGIVRKEAAPPEPDVLPAIPKHRRRDDAPPTFSMIGDKRW